MLTLFKKNKQTKRTTDIYFKAASAIVLYITIYLGKRSIHHCYSLNYSGAIGLAQVIKRHKILYLTF